LAVGSVINRKTRGLARTLVGPDCQSGQPRFCRTAARCSPAVRQHHPSLEPVTGESSIRCFWKRREIRWRLCRRPGRGYLSCLCRLPYPGASKPTGRARPWPAIFGRRIATVPGYNFSESLKRLDIVWSGDSFKVVRDRTFSYTQVPRCPSSVSVRNRTAPRGAIS